MIRADNLAFSYADQPLYTGAHFTVDSTQIAGLVGPNGAGKSTLLKIIMGEYPLDAGTISVHGKIGYVPQEVKTDPVLDAANSAREYLNPSSTLYDYELEDVLKGLEMVGVSLDAVPRTMSGGQKTKLALARALLSQPDILLLDEPTNFLDIEGKKWVMRFLSTYPHSVVIISHDLKLLDAFIDKVIYINPQTQTITEFNGNYSNYVKQVALAEARLKREITTKQKHIEQMRKSLQKMARFTSEKGVRRKTMLRHRMEKMIDTLPEMPKELRKIRFQLQEPARVGELPIMVKHLSKAYGDNVIIEDLSFSIKRGERMALIGYNGAGKSTLIKMLVGLLEANSGEIVKDEKLSFGYYSQEFETFDMDKTPIDVANEQSDKEVSYFRGLFGRFLLSKDTVFQKISTLSGGEKTRLSIALLLLQNYNLLILDEPTTYLDVFSQRVILEALKDYKGALLIVSHTEEFIRELKPDRALILPDEKIVLWDDSLLDRVSDV